LNEPQLDRLLLFFSWFIKILLFSTFSPAINYENLAGVNGDGAARTAGGLGIEIGERELS
jgi:hypothetical protein